MPDTIVQTTVQTIVQTIGGYAGLAAILIFAIDKVVKLTTTSVDDQIWEMLKGQLAAGNLLNSDAKPADNAADQDGK
jgi:hypothetical protein